MSVAKDWTTGLLLYMLTRFRFKLSVRYGIKLPCSEWTLNYLLVYFHRLLVGHNASSVLLDVKNNKRVAILECTTVYELFKSKTISLKNLWFGKKYIGQKKRREYEANVNSGYCNAWILKGRWKRCWWFSTFIDFIWLQLNCLKIQYLVKLPLCILCMAEHSRKEIIRSNLVYLKQ